MIASIEGDVYTIGIEVVKMIDADDFDGRYNAFSVLDGADYLDFNQYDIDGYYADEIVDNYFATP